MSDPRPASFLSSVSRRTLLGAGLAVAALAATALAVANRGPAPVTVDDIMKTDLPDIVIGKPGAPVTIIEYASMGCNHCAAFHASVLPQLRAKYIDPGIAKLHFRDFPLDEEAALVSMLARCAAPERAADLIAEMFKRQAEWADLEGPAAIKKLQELAQPFGFTEASFKTCVSNKKLLGQIEAGRERANKRFGVNATPTLFVNGRKLASHAMADIDKAIEPLLKK